MAARVSTYCSIDGHDRCPRPRTCGCDCHRPPPEEGETMTERLACPVPGCDRDFSRQNGLTRHLNQSHALRPRAEEEAEEIASEVDAYDDGRPALPTSVQVDGELLVLTDDVAHAIGFLEDRPARDVLNELLRSWCRAQREDDHVEELVRLRQNRRGR